MCYSDKFKLLMHRYNCVSPKMEGVDILITGNVCYQLKHLLITPASTENIRESVICNTLKVFLLPGN